MKKFDFTNPAQWKLEAFCVFAPLCDEDGCESENYYIAESIAEFIAEQNEYDGPTTRFGTPQLEWWSRDWAHKYAADDSRFKTRGTCDHCGAHFAYGAAYRNIVTDEYAIVGHICATNKLNLTADEYARKRAGEAMKRARQRAKADMREARLNKHRRALLHFDDGFNAYDRNEKRREFAIDLCRDMRHKFRKYESLSVKQWAFLKDVVTKENARIERMKADADNMTPIPDDLFNGRHTFTGKIVHTKVVDTMYGSSIKMLFIDDRNFKLFGTVPSSLPYNVGDRVQFDAALDASDDATFAFYNRPTKAKNLEEAA